MLLIFLRIYAFLSREKLPVSVAESECWHDPIGLLAAQAAGTDA
jgi:hypothetical protein